MDVVTGILTGAGIAALALEGIKQLLRLVPSIGKDFDFPTKFYLIMLPILEVVVQPLLVWLEVSDGVLALDLKSVVLVTIQSLVSVIVYNQGIKPMKEYYTRVNA